MFKISPKLIGQSRGAVLTWSPRHLFELKRLKKVFTNSENQITIINNLSEINWSKSRDYVNLAHRFFFKFLVFFIHLLIFKFTIIYNLFGMDLTECEGLRELSHPRFIFTNVQLMYNC